MCKQLYIQNKPICLNVLLVFNLSRDKMIIRTCITKDITHRIQIQYNLYLGNR